MAPPKRTLSSRASSTRLERVDFLEYSIGQESLVVAELTKELYIDEVKHQDAKEEIKWMEAKVSKEERNLGSKMGVSKAERA